MERQEYKKFFRKVGIFLLPFLLALFVELFILPIDFFTYRVWETLKVDSQAAGLFLPGPFYPNMEVHKIEMGDMGVHTQYAVPKDVIWRTDSHGFRTDRVNSNYDVLIVGDSTVVGTSLTQEDTLAPVLAKKSGLNVYPLGAKEIQNVLYNPQFNSKPPKFVILTSIERFITAMSLSLDNKSTSRIYYSVIGFMDRWHLNGLRPVFVLADRLLKENMYHSLLATVDRYLKLPKVVMVYGQPPIMFYQGDAANKDLSDVEIESVALKITAVHKALEERGIKLIFLPVPNKETVYWDLLPGRKPADFLPRLIKSLHDKGVTIVDTQTAFLQATAKRGKILYNSDDTHWNAEGVSEAVDLLVPLLKK